MELSSNVWNRARTRAQGDLSEREYIGAVSFFTLFGLAASSVLAYNTLQLQLGILPMILLIIAPFVGIFISFGSDNWLTSFLGYTLVFVPFGILMGPTCALYQSGVILNAVAATAGVTMVTSVVGIVYPDFTRGWGKYLFAGLLALILVRFAQIFTVSMGLSPEILDWPLIDYLGAALFSCYIMYDWGRAMELPRTMDNAVDVSVALYLDILNLFLHLLQIMGSSSSSSD